MKNPIVQFLDANSDRARQVLQDVNRAMQAQLDLMQEITDTTGATPEAVLGTMSQWFEDNHEDVSKELAQLMMNMQKWEGEDE